MFERLGRKQSKIIKEKRNMRKHMLMEIEIRLFRKEIFQECAWKSGRMRVRERTLGWELRSDR